MKIDYDRLGRMAGWMTVGLVIGAALVIGADAFAQEWVTVSRPKGGGSYDVQVGSFNIGRNDGGEPIALVTMRYVAPGARSITFEKDYVTLKHCAAGQGNLVTMYLTGVYNYHTEFIIGGGNSASVIAEFICGLARGGRSL